MLKKRNIHLLLLTPTAIYVFLHRFPFYRRLHPDCEPVEKKKKSSRLISNLLSLFVMIICLPQVFGGRAGRWCLSWFGVFLVGLGWGGVGVFGFLVTNTRF